MGGLAGTVLKVAVKVSLINPPWINTGNTSGVRAGSRWPHVRRNYFKIFPFPYRLAEATSLLKNDGHEAVLVDALAEGIDDAELLRRIRGTDLFVVETATKSLQNDIVFLKWLRESFPKAVIATVGQHAAIGAQDLAPHCDHVLAYEYDLKVKNLANGLPPGDDPVDLKQIPWPFRDPLTFHLYQEGFCTAFPNATVTTSRGCPYACTFCQEPTVFYRKPGRRLRDPVGVVEEWQTLNRDFNAREIYIDDSTFSADEPFVHAILDEIERKKFKIRFSAMGDARISDELLVRLRKNGFTGIKIGVESIHPHILKGIHKQWLKREDVERTVKTCRRLGIFVHGTFILGLPGDTPATIRETVDYALKTPFNFVQFSPFIPMPGTRIFAEVKEKGWIKAGEDSSGNVIVDRPELSSRELDRLYCDAQARISRRVFTRLYLAWKYVRLARVARDTNLFSLIFERAKQLFSKR